MIGKSNLSSQRADKALPAARTMLRAVLTAMRFPPGSTEQGHFSDLLEVMVMGP